MLRQASCSGQVLPLALGQCSEYRLQGKQLPGRRTPRRPEDQPPRGREVECKTCNGPRSNRHDGPLTRSRREDNQPEVNSIVGQPPQRVGRDIAEPLRAPRPMACAEGVAPIKPPGDRGGRRKSNNLRRGRSDFGSDQCDQARVDNKGQRANNTEPQELGSCRGPLRSVAFRYSCHADRLIILTAVSHQATPRIASYGRQRPRKPHIAGRPAGGFPAARALRCQE